MYSLPTRILIVEDNPDDVTLLLRQLKKAKLARQLKVIVDGGAALEDLTDERCNAEDLIAVFLDLRLPTVTGIQLLEVIRSNDRIRNLHVIIMTSSTAEEQIERCRQLGVSAYVRKPVSFSAFAKAVADSFEPGTPLTQTARLAASAE